MKFRNDPNQETKRSNRERSPGTSWVKKLGGQEVEEQAKSSNWEAKQTAKLRSKLEGTAKQSSVRLSPDAQTLPVVVQGPTLKCRDTDT